METNRQARQDPCEFEATPELINLIGSDGPWYSPEDWEKLYEEAEKSAQEEAEEELPRIDETIERAKKVLRNQPEDRLINPSQAHQVLTFRDKTPN